MSLKVDRVQLDIIINNDPTRKQMQELDKELRTLQKDIKKVAEGTEEWTAKSNRIKEIKSQMDGLKKTIGLTGMTMKELIAHQKELNMTLQHMRPGTKEFNLLQQELRETSARIGELRGKSATTGLSIGKMADGFNKYFGVITAVAASFTGIILGVRKAIDTFNEFESKVANLSALTGLAGDDLQWLSDKAKELSTSTTESGVKITSSADVIVDAFTKMGSAQPALLEDKEALAAVTEQALILAEASKMELDDAVQGLANTMNQFGASADEAARYVNVLAAGAQAGAQEVPYISDAIVKFGAAAADFNIPIEQSVALIETLGEKGLQAEVAGTGIRRFLLKLASGADETNPKVVGLETALENLSAKNMSAAETMKMFGEEGYLAAQNIIANKDRVLELTEAVTGTNVATEQAIVNTETNSAKLEQARNKAKLMAIELGEKLAPALTFSTNAMSYMMKGIKLMIEFYQEHKAGINATVAAITAYTVAMNYSVVADKLKSMWTDKIKTSIKSLYETMLKHPYAAIAAAVAGVVVFLISYANEMKKISAESKVMADASSKASAEIGKQKAALQEQLNIAKDSNRTLEEREQAIKKINEISPEYLGNITLENINTKETTDQVTKYTEAIKEKAMAQAYSNMLEEEYAKQAELQMKTFETQGLWTRLWKGEGLAQRKGAVESAKALWEKERKEELDAIQKRIDAITKLQGKNKATVNTPSTGPKEGDTKTEDGETFVYKNGSWQLVPRGPGGGGDADKKTSEAQKKADELEKKLEELRQRAKELNRQVMLDAMSENNRELAIIRDKYDKDLQVAGITSQKLLELKAKQYEDMTKEEQTLWTAYLAINDAQAAELDAKKNDQKKKAELKEKEEKEAKEAFLREMHDLQLSDMDAEIAASQDKYEKLIKQAEKFDIDTKGLLIMASAENAAIQEKYRKQDEQKEKEHQQIILGAKLSTLQSTSRIIGSVMDMMGEKSQKNAQFQKGLALAQIGIDTGVAVASGVRSAMDSWGDASPWQKIAAVAAIVAEIIAATSSAYSLLNKNEIPQYYEGLYPVIGEQTGRTYMSAISASAATRVVQKPTMLVGEEKPEMIIDGDTYSRMQMNAPELVRAIYSFRSPQFSGGYYPGATTSTGISTVSLDERSLTVMQRYTDVMEKISIEGLSANVEYRKIQSVASKEAKLLNDFNP